MCNSIFIDDKTLPKAKDGEEFEVTVKGVFRIDQDGDRKLDISSVEGNDVVGPDQNQSDCGCSGMDSNAALDIFLIKNKNKG